MLQPPPYHLSLSLLPFTRRLSSSFSVFESLPPFSPSFALSIMESDTGDSVKIISRTISRRNTVDVCPSLLLYGSKNPEMVTVRHYSVSQLIPVTSDYLT